MKVFERYFRQHEPASRLEFSEGVELIVIVPVFDDPEIFETLRSLGQCDACGGNIGVVVVVNHPENCPESVKRRNRQLSAALRTDRKTILPDGRVAGKFRFEVLEAFDLPVKTAGVGLARKIAMDAAAAYFYENGSPDGIIASLDADTLVEKNYFLEISRLFRSGPVAGASIAYEHRLDDPECSGGIRDAMIKYEIYLRYYRLALQYCGHPHFYHCIGSAFAVRASDYAAQGGMNKRQAGEDFYFIQKLISTGRYADITATKVYPSPRISERTPFGTGRSVSQIVEDCGQYPVYCFEAFRLLKQFFALLPQLYRADAFETDAFLRRLPAPLRDFLSEIGFEDVVGEVNANCASEKQFVRRFFDNFNAFRVLKYLNFVHQQEFAKTDVIPAVLALAADIGFSLPDSPLEILLALREKH